MMARMRRLWLSASPSLPVTSMSEETRSHCALGERAYIGCGRGPIWGGRGCDQPDPQALSREQEGQGLPHNATASNADV